MFEKINNRQYLEQKHKKAEMFVGTTREERVANFKESALIMSNPFVEVVYKKEGEVSFSIEKEIDEVNYKTDIYFSYDSDCSNATVFGNPTATGLDLNRMRRLKRLKLESNKYMFDSDRDPIPKYGLYFFDTNGLNEKELLKHILTGQLAATMDNVIVGNPPNTPLGLTSLFHELSHHWRNISDPERGLLVSILSNRIHSERPLSDEEKSIILNEERSVEATYIKDLINILKPIVDRRHIEVISKSFLQSYSYALLEHENNFKKSE